MSDVEPTTAVPATQYSITLRVTLENVPGVLGRLTTAIGEVAVDDETAITLGGGAR